MPHEPLPSGPTVEAAIGKVLAAEREARESVLACRRQADERLETARREARLIGERYDLRIQAMRQACAQALAQRLAALQGESSRLKQAGAPAAGKPDLLRHAVAAMARECTGDTT
jgi:regulator of protease activity HflC (stomatin/prohibitin superfamily)